VALHAAVGGIAGPATFQQIGGHRRASVANNAAMRLAVEKNGLAAKPFCTK
jgi:hypothetical protein